MLKSGKFIESSRADNTRQWASPSAVPPILCCTSCSTVFAFGAPYWLPHPTPPPPCRHPRIHQPHHIVAMLSTHPCISLSPSLTRCVRYTLYIYERIVYNVYIYKGKLPSSSSSSNVAGGIYSQVSNYTTHSHHPTSLYRRVTTAILPTTERDSFVVRQVPPLRINIKHIYSIYNNI